MDYNKNKGKIPLFQALLLTDVL